LKNGTDLIEKAYYFTKSLKYYGSTGETLNDDIHRGKIFVSKLAEIYIGKVLGLGLGLGDCGTDLSIYDSDHKNWFLPDLVGDGYFYHIKSCQNSERYPESWLFNKKEIPIFDEYDQRLVLANTNHKGGLEYLYKNVSEISISVRFCIKMESKMKSLFREPILDSLKQSKSVLYGNDLIGGGYYAKNNAKISILKGLIK
jgi:hypothetical protein